MSALDRGDPAVTMQYVENKTYDEIAVGDHAELTRTLKPQDIELFAVMSGDVNPAHVDADYAKTDMFHDIIAHGIWGGALALQLTSVKDVRSSQIYTAQTWH